MSDDSEALEVVREDPPSDLTSVVSGAFETIPFKLLAYIFIIYIFVSSDIFAKRILSGIDGAVSMNSVPSTYGTVLTGLLLVSATATAHVLLQKKII